MWSFTVVLFCMQPLRFSNFQTLRPPFFCYHLLRTKILHSSEFKNQIKKSLDTRKFSVSQTSFQTFKKWLIPKNSCLSQIYLKIYITCICIIYKKTTPATTDLLYSLPSLSRPPWTHPPIPLRLETHSLRNPWRCWEQLLLINKINFKG